MTRLRVLLVALSLLLTAPLHAQSPPTGAALDALANDVSSQLRCPVCQGLSIQDSPSELAQNMRAVVRDQLAQGRTPEEVKAYFVQSYGEWVLLQPRATGFNLTVYALPIIAALAGAVFIVVLARRWSRKPEAGDAVIASLSDDPDLVAWDDLAPR